MKTRTIVALITLSVLMTALVVSSEASLLNIGTASYGGTDYNLIYETGVPGGPIVWLDYTNPATIWSYQETWASSLNVSGTLTYNFCCGYSMNWNTGPGSGWQLPTTVDQALSASNPPSPYSSQMAYLYYTDLGNTNTTGLVHTGPFTKLTSNWYWSGTEYMPTLYFGTAWLFGLFGGYQSYENEGFNAYGLAVNPGTLIAHPTHFSVAAPATATAGTAFNFTLTALDQNNDTVSTYSGTVNFTISSDPLAVLPANYTFVTGDAGSHTFSATCNTLGNQTITSTDTVTTSISGTSNIITVNTGPVKSGEIYYPIIMTAYDTLSSPIVLDLWASYSGEIPTFSLAKTITLIGGFDSGYVSNTGGTTSVQGPLFINSGELIVQQIVIN